MNPKLRILIVDDDKRMTRTLADILSMSGYEAVEANSGQDALEKVRTQVFECVLSDVKMPDMNGVDLHRLLHQVQPGLPVLLMTAYAADELIRQGLDDGVVGVFDKPLSMNHLLAFFSSLEKNHTVVIVDNDPNFCQTLADILCQRGFKVIQVTDPPADVQLIAADAQIILLDLHLKLTNGLEVLKEIRKHHPTLPVLLVSGYREEMAAIIQNATAIDAYACLYKPLEIPELLRMLSEVQLKRLRGFLKNNKEPATKP
jgi:DNA-binding response OmpR family regulator